MHKKYNQQLHINTIRVWGWFLHLCLNANERFRFLRLLIRWISRDNHRVAQFTWAQRINSVELCMQVCNISNQIYIWIHGVRFNGKTTISAYTAFHGEFSVSGTYEQNRVIRERVCKRIHIGESDRQTSCKWGLFMKWKCGMFPIMRDIVEQNLNYWTSSKNGAREISLKFPNFQVLYVLSFFIYLIQATVRLLISIYRWSLFHCDFGHIFGTLISVWGNYGRGNYNRPPI